MAGGMAGYEQDLAFELADLYLIALVDADVGSDGLSVEVADGAVDLDVGGGGIDLDVDLGGLVGGLLGN